VANLPEQLFPGIIGYDNTVIPEIENAILSCHDIILLGERGQAKTRIMRSLATLLDESLPVISGCEINDDPFHPLCKHCHQQISTQIILILKSHPGMMTIA
jgi:magnesium chelatase subunit I